MQFPLVPLSVALIALGSPSNGTAQATADWSLRVTEEIRRSEYDFTALEPGVWSAPNRSQELRSCVDRGGLAVFPRTVESGAVGVPWRVRFRTEGFGRVGDVRPSRCATVDVGGGRAQLDHGALIEWWVNDERGIEQGWTLAHRPEGSQLLVLRIGLAIDGDLELRVEEAGAAVFVDGAGDARMRYGGLAAWDAAGRGLPSRIRASASGLEVLVDDAGAIYPVTVDPLVTCASWSVEGSQLAASLGASAAGAGDVNGDGYDDVVVGASYYDNGKEDEGRVFLYLGSAGGLATTAAWTAESNRVRAYFGHSASSAGDVNGDGFSDVIIGAYGYTNVEAGEGRAYVYHGYAGGLRSNPGWAAEPNQAGAEFGFSVSTAGDVNGDGFSDVIVGARLYDGGSVDEGRAFVYLGSAGGLSTTPAWTAGSGQAGARFGDSVSTAGDVNGDRYSDVIVGSPLFDDGERDEGRAWVYLGSAAGLSQNADWTAESNQESALLGSAVSAAGDVNGDAYGDVVVGAERYTGGEQDEGAAFVYLGSAAGLETGFAWSAEANQSFSAFGGVVSHADVNGDGFADVLVGAPTYGGDNGRAYAYHGSAAGPAATAAWSVESENSVSYLAVSLASAGDVNGDGYDDVIVGEIGYGNFKGRALVYHGSSTGLYDGTAAVGWRNRAPNVNSYVAAPPVLGRNWTATVDVAMTHHSHAQILGFTAGSAPTPLPGGQVLLVTGTQIMKLAPQPGPLATWSMPVPNDPALCGFTLYTQAIHLFGAVPFALTNAQDLTGGS